MRTPCFRMRAGLNRNRKNALWIGRFASFPLFFRDPAGARVFFVSYLIIKYLNCYYFGQIRRLPIGYLAMSHFVAVRGLSGYYYLLLDLPHNYIIEIFILTDQLFY